MQRFLELSQPFRDAHFQPRPPTFAARLLWALGWLLWVAACGLLPAPRPLTAERKPAPAASTAAEADPSHLSGTPRQERQRTAPAVQMPYIAVWERRFDAQFPAHFPAHLPTVEGGAL